MLFQKRLVKKESHSTEKFTPPAFAFGKGRVLGLYDHTFLELYAKAGYHGVFGHEIKQNFDMPK